VVQFSHVLAVLVVQTSFRTVVIHEAHNHVGSVEFLLRINVLLECGFLKETITVRMVLASRHSTLYTYSGLKVCESGFRSVVNVNFLAPEQRNGTTSLDVSVQSAVALVGFEEQLFGLNVVRDIAVLVHTTLVVTSAGTIDVTTRDQAKVERGRANSALGYSNDYHDINIPLYYIHIQSLTYSP
jgi:hypothetical protein